MWDNSYLDKAGFKKLLQEKEGRHLQIDEGEIAVKIGGKSSYCNSCLLVESI